MKRIVLVALALALSACNPPVADPPPVTPPSVTPAAHYFTFEEVSKPYLDQYGTAEEVNKYDSGDYHTVDWWWWTKGFEVEFANTSYDAVNGWAVASTYSFTPIP